MNEATDRWCVSGDGECFWGTEAVTREQAIDEGLYQFRRALAGHDTDCFDPSEMPEEGASFYIGKRVDFVPTVDEITVVEQLQMDAYEECGEYGETFLDDLFPLDRALLKQKLQAALDEWLKETSLQPNFFTVKDVEMIKVADHRKRWKQIKEKAAGNHEQQ